MPGFTIHIITAKEYIKKHPNEIKNEEEFIEGTIAPDLTNNKSETHYGIWKNLIVTTYLNKMLEDPKVNINKDYWKGYFLHLYVDNKFYHKYFAEEWKEVVKNDDRLFHDYDLLNKDLIFNYEINIENYPEEIRKYMRPLDTNEKPKYLNFSKLKNMIKELSEININSEVERIRKEEKQ